MKDGYRLSLKLVVFCDKDVEISFISVLFNTAFDVNREVENGRGIVDYTISKGAMDKTLIEFKLASNSKLKSNLQHQLSIYAKANDTDKYISVILYFTDKEEHKVKRLLRELNIANKENVIIIDARNNKISASNV